MKAYGAESRVDAVAKKTASERDPQRRKRRALKKKQRRAALPPTNEPTRADYGFDRVKP